MSYPFSASSSERACQICPNALAVAEVLKKRLSTPFTTAFWDPIGEWTTQNEPKRFVLLNVAYVQDETHVQFLAILTIARMVIWTTWKKGLYDNANFSHHDLVLYFRRQLRVKIRCDRLDCITFDKRRVNTVSLVVRKGQCYSHPSLLFLPMASTVRVTRDPVPGKTAKCFPFEA